MRKLGKKSIILGRSEWGRTRRVESTPPFQDNILLEWLSPILQKNKENMHIISCEKGKA